MSLLLALLLSQAEVPGVLVADLGVTLRERVMETCEGQVCYLRCSGTQRLYGSLVISGAAAGGLTFGSGYGESYATPAINIPIGGTAQNWLLTFGGKTAASWELAIGYYNGALTPMITTRAADLWFNLPNGNKLSPLTDNVNYLGDTTRRWLGAYVSSVFMSAGSSANTVTATGFLSIDTTGVGNVGASGPDDLQTYTLAASSLTTTNRCIKVRAYGTTANNANAKTVRLVIGPTPTAIITKQLTASVAGTWSIEARICRTGASTQDYFAEAHNFGGTTVSSTDGATVQDLAAFGTLTQTETNALVIKTQSTVSTSNNDIISEGLQVFFE